MFQVGFLTLGSHYLPCLPIQLKLDSDIFTAFVPDYSGGPVPDFNRVPYYALNAPEINF